MRRAFVISILLLCFLMVPIFDASGAPKMVSRTLRTSIRVTPKLSLKVEEDKVESFLDSEILSHALSSDNDNIFIERGILGGQKIVLVTKVCE